MSSGDYRYGSMQMTQWRNRWFQSIHGSYGLLCSNKLFI